MKKTVFSQIKVGDVIKDSWYGPGRVVYVGKTICEIHLDSEDEAFTYDMSHVNAFITITSPKRSTVRKHSENDKKTSKK